MEENQSVFELQVDQSAAKNLSGASGWAKFLAIVIFIAIGLCIISFVALRQQITDTFSQFVPGINASQSFGVIMAVIAVVAIVCILLMVLLFKGAVLIRRGIQTKNQQTFKVGLASLKGYFSMYGVIAI